MAMKTFLSLLILSIIFLHKIDGAPSQKALKNYEVYIFDLLPKANSKLITHCFSGNDDFGNHTLTLNQQQSWRFKSNLFGTTLYSCHFWWGSKQRAFDIFSTKNASACETAAGNVCGWTVREDGFYFAPHKQFTPATRKTFDWQ